MRDYPSKLMHDERGQEVVCMFPNDHWLMVAELKHLRSVMADLEEFRDKFETIIREVSFDHLSGENQ